MKKQSIYKNLAKYYDIIYSWKDYRKESNKIYNLIKRYKKIRGNTLLDVACGTGNHIQYLKKYYKITGIDLNKEVLRIAKKKFQKLRFVKANMVSFNLKKKFDIVVCLFSSIGYVKTYENLRKTIENFSKHLNQRGVLIIEPWVTPQNYMKGSPHLTVYDKKDIKMVRMSVAKSKGNLSIIDFHYLIAERNKDTKHFVDRHETGLFDTSRTLKFMKEAGLKSKFLKKGLMKGRGLFIGIKI